MKVDFKNKKAFTLIEVLLAIAVIGILSSILILNNQSAVEKAIDVKVKTFANSLPIVLSGNYIANWKFDQVNFPSANQTPDSWGANNGTLGDGSTSSTFPTLLFEPSCVFGQCFSFDGTSDYVDCGNSVDFDFTKFFTLEAWIYRSADGGSYERIISKSSISSYNYWLQIRPGNILDVGICATAGAKYLQGNKVIDLSKWYHVVAVKDMTNFYIYLDGVLDASGITAGGTMDDVVLTNYPLNIGRLGSAGTWYYSFNGRIDDVRIYNESLELGKIQENYLIGLKNLLVSNQISPDEYRERLIALSNNPDLAKK